MTYCIIEKIYKSYRSIKNLYTRHYIDFCGRGNILASDISKLLRVSNSFHYLIMQEFHFPDDGTISRAE